MRGSNTKKSYGSRLRSKSRGRRFNSDKQRLKMSRMSRGTYRSDKGLLAESDKRLNKRAGRWITKSPKDKSGETSLNRVRKILRSIQNNLNR